MTDPTDLPIPAAWRPAAEEVRAHLCTLRGGAPFLSPADAWQLVRWFEEGVPVSAVLAAIERAAAYRRKTRSRLPLTLVRAKPHLGKGSDGWFRRAPIPIDPGEPLAPLVRTLELVPEGSDRTARAELAAALLAVTGSGDEALRAAVGAIREFFDALWIAAAADHDRLRAAAVEELGDLLSLVDERTRVALVEETARDRLRQRYPALTAATVGELLDRAQG